MNEFGYDANHVLFTAHGDGTISGRIAFNTGRSSNDTDNGRERTTLYKRFARHFRNNDDTDPFRPQQVRVLRYCILGGREKRHVGTLLVRQRLPDPTQQPTGPFHLNRKHAIRVREAKHIRIPPTDRDPM